MGGAKDKIMGLFKANQNKHYNKPKLVKNVPGGGKKPQKLKIKKQSEDKIIKNIRHPFKLKKENEPINGRIIREIKTLFYYEEDYHKLTRIDNFWTNNYIEYESNGDRNKTLSIKEYLDVIKPYLKDIINNLQKSDTWKTQ